MTKTKIGKNKVISHEHPGTVGVMNYIPEHFLNEVEEHGGIVIRGSSTVEPTYA